MTLFGGQDAAVLRGLAAADPAVGVLRCMRPHDFCGAHVYCILANLYEITFSPFHYIAFY